MTLRQYLLVMGAGTLIAYILFFNILFLFDPADGLMPAALMYASIALCSIGTFSIFGFVLRHYFSPQEIVFREVLVSFRQSIWFAVLITTSLALKHLGIFSFVSLSFLIVSLGALELFIMSSKRS